MMHPITRAGLGLSLALLGLSCGSNKVLVPPRLDLQPYGKVAIVLFTVENARGSLHQLATERFAEAVLAAQPGIELLELGSQDTLVRRVGEQELGIAAAQELGRQRGVTAVFLEKPGVLDLVGEEAASWFVRHLEIEAVPAALEGEAPGEAPVEAPAALH